MAQKTFHCKVVTPAASIVDEDITYAKVPAWDGSFGVMADRAPILARLGVGVLRLDFADTAKGAGGSRQYVIDGGFAQMVNNNLMILAEGATAVETIALSEAEKELAALESRTIPENEPNRAVKVEELRRQRERARARVTAAKNAAGI